MDDGERYNEANGSFCFLLSPSFEAYLQKKLIWVTPCFFSNLNYQSFARFYYHIINWWPMTAHPDLFSSLHLSISSQSYYSSFASKYLNAFSNITGTSGSPSNELLRECILTCALDGLVEKRRCQQKRRYFLHYQVDVEQYSHQLRVAKERTQNKK